MNKLKILNPVPEKLSGNQVIISNSTFTQLIEYTNSQTYALNTLIESLENLTEIVKQLSDLEEQHHKQVATKLQSSISTLSSDIEKLQNQVSTLAKSISIFLGGE